MGHRWAAPGAVHLTGLCCAVENAGGPEVYWRISRWLDGNVVLDRPRDVSIRGTMTIADVWLSVSDPEYAARVRAWASDVSAAYLAHHDLARQWVDEVRRHASERR